jgi:tetratricopeptide (TPR) repeat protein
MTRAPHTPDPIEIAMEAEAAGAPPAGVAHAVLVRQEQLIGWQVASERAGVALKLLTGLAGLVVAVAIGLMAWRASRADGVVIEPFSTPPDMAARGYTGQALAARIQDRLKAMQADTNNVRAAATYANDWGHEVRVEIAQTGVSLSDVDKVLRGWLGHESHVGGDLVRATLPGGGAGLSLTIRSETAGDEVTGDEADMNGLLQRAAETLYRRTQPYRYGDYLRTHNRPDEARAVFTNLSENGPRPEQAWAFVGLGRMEPDPARRRVLGVEAIRRNGDLAMAWRTLASAAQSQGDYEEAWRANRRSVELLEGSDHGGVDPKSRQYTFARSDLRTFSGDFSGCLADAVEGEALAPTAARRRDLHGSVIYCTGLTHDVSGLRRLTGGVDDGEALRRQLGSQGEWNAVWTTHDWASGLANSRAEEQALLALPDPGLWARAKERFRPQQAMMLAKLGRVDEARAALLGLEPEGYWAITARALIAEAAGQRVEADRLFDGLVRRMPHVAWTYAQWGRLHLDRGDAAGAMAIAERGLKVAPRYADLHLIEADAYLRQGQPDLALKSAKAADALTPKWGVVHLKWGEALARLGKPEEARRQFQAAAALDLAADERAELARVSR